MEINTILEKYIVDELIMPDGKRAIDPDESLISSGVIDSLAIMRLIAFVEERFGVMVEDEEVVPANFDTVNMIRTLVENKLNVNVNSDQS